MLLPDFTHALALCAVLTSRMPLPGSYVMPGTEPAYGAARTISDPPCIGADSVRLTVSPGA
eukprot:263118-Rhodomonas_salina.6